MTIKGWDTLLGEFMVQILNSRNVDKVQMADRNSYFADWSFVCHVDFPVDFMNGRR